MMQNNLNPDEKK